VKNKMTPFQCRVFKLVMTIPFGETRTYQWVAEHIGMPGSARAVGQALRRNPYPIIIPCHRVVRSSGEPGGYAGGPPDQKLILLAKEQEVLEAIRENL
jgi:methylated-DNA-[protein]-cysteine S-methyltransferase